LDEIRAKSLACHGVTVDESGSPVRQTVTATLALTGLPSGIRGFHAEADSTGTVSGTQRTLHSSGTIQQKGRFVTIVWTNQSSPLSAGDRSVIDHFVAEQTSALAATG
jgi:hypothetical protein